MEQIELRRKVSCPHCDMPMNLNYDKAAFELILVCADGCKAEYSLTLTIGQTREIPICGAKRVRR